MIESDKIDTSIGAQNVVSDIRRRTRLSDVKFTKDEVVGDKLTCHTRIKATLEQSPKFYAVTFHGAICGNDLIVECGDVYGDVLFAFCSILPKSNEQSEICIDDITMFTTSKMWLQHSVSNVKSETELLELASQVNAFTAMSASEFVTKDTFLNGYDGSLELEHGKYSLMTMLLKAIHHPPAVTAWTNLEQFLRSSPRPEIHQDDLPIVTELPVIEKKHFVITKSGLLSAPKSLRSLYMNNEKFNAQIAVVEGTKRVRVEHSAVDNDVTILPGDSVPPVSVKSKRRGGKRQTKVVVKAEKKAIPRPRSSKAKTENKENSPPGKIMQSVEASAAAPDIMSLKQDIYCELKTLVVESIKTLSSAKSEKASDELTEKPSKAVSVKGKKSRNKRPRAKDGKFVANSESDSEEDDQPQSPYMKQAVQQQEMSLQQYNVNQSSSHGGYQHYPSCQPQSVRRHYPSFEQIQAQHPPPQNMYSRPVYSSFRPSTAPPYRSQLRQQYVQSNVHYNLPSSCPPMWSHQRQMPSSSSSSNRQSYRRRKEKIIEDITNKVLNELDWGDDVADDHDEYADY